MPDTMDGSEDPLALVLAATEAARPAVAGGAEERALAKVDAMIALMLAAIRKGPVLDTAETDAWNQTHRARLSGVLATDIKPAE